VFAVKPSVVLLLGAAFLAWCSPARTLAQVKRTGVYHPQEHLYPDSKLIIERDEKNTAGSKLTAHEEALRDAEIELRIGSRDGEDGEVIGGIEEVKVHGDRLYVLDNQYKEVKVYRTDGRYLQSFARQGAGPGEVQVPKGMDIDSDGRIWIADQKRRMVFAYQWTGEEYELITEFRTKVAPKEVCVQDGNVYIYGLSAVEDNVKPIFEYSDDGRQLRSFGSLCKSDELIIAHQFSEVTSMECTPSGKLVLDYARLSASAMVSIAEGGIEALFKYKSKEIFAEEVVLKDQKSVEYNFGEEYEMGGSLCMRENKFVVSRRMMSLNGEIDSTVLYRVDLLKRTVTKLGDSDWQCQVFQNGHLVMSCQTPYPQIAVMEY